MTQRKIGDTLDRLGVELDLEDDDLVEAVMVIARISRSDGPRGVMFGMSAGMDWLDQGQLLWAANAILRDQDD